jgi:hypothetical protein
MMSMSGTPAPCARVAPPRRHKWPLSSVTAPPLRATSALVLATHTWCVSAAMRPSSCMQNAGSAQGAEHSARIVSTAGTGSSACPCRPVMLMLVTRSRNWFVLGVAQAE